MRILPADPVYRHPVKNQKDDTFKYVPGKMLMELFDNFFYIIDGGKCFGGVARLKKTVNDISIQHKNVVFVNSGDFYQGTMWYTSFKWEVVAEFANMLNFTAAVSFRKILKIFSCWLGTQKLRRWTTFKGHTTL